MIKISDIIQLVDVATEFGAQGLLFRPELACHLNKHGKIFGSSAGVLHRLSLSPEDVESSDEDSSDEERSEEEYSGEEKAGDCKSKAEAFHTKNKKNAQKKPSLLPFNRTRNERASGKTALGLAVVEGNKKAIAALLEAKADINLADHWGNTVLHYAVEKNFLDIASLLLSQGANVNAENQYRNWDAAPLHIAARKHNITLMHLLLEHKADINQRFQAEDDHPYRYQSTPLIAAINPFNSSWDCSWSISFEDKATLERYNANRYQTVEALLKAKADAWASDSRDRTPLYHAIMEEVPSIISLLKAHGATTEDRGVFRGLALNLHEAIGNYSKKSRLRFNKDGLSDAEIQKNKEKVILELLGPDTINLTNCYNQTPLCQVIEAGVTPLVHLLIEEKATLDIPCEHDQNTALISAAKRNDPDYVKLLLAAKASANFVAPRHNETALHAAVGGSSLRTHYGERLKNPALELPNRIACVTALLQAKADVNLRDRENDSALHMAIRHHGQVQVVTLLCDEKADVHHANKHNETPLQLAIRNRNLDCVETLVKAKANVNASNEQGRTALHLAAGYGMAEGIPFIYKIGAVNINDSGDSSAKSYLPSRPLTLAINSLHYVLNPMAALSTWDTANVYPTIYRLLELKASPEVYDDGRNYLHIITARGHADLLRTFIYRKRKWLNARDKKGETPVHVAIQHDHDICLQVLLESKADLNLKPTEEVYKDMPLIHYAAIMNAGKCIPRLLAYGEDLAVPYVTANSKLISTPILTAVRNKKLAAYQALLQAKADLSSVNHNGCNLFDVAVIQSNAEIIPWLLERGFKVNTKNKKNGDTPLILAAYNDQLQVAQILLDAKADIHDVDKAGNTALHWAAARGAYDIIPMLIAYGADISRLNNKGEFPLVLSKAGYTTELLKIIDLVQPCFDPGHLQVLADYIEEKYLKSGGDHLLTWHRDIRLLNLIKNAIDESFDLIFKNILEKLEAVQAELKLSAEENAKKNEERKEMLKDTMLNLLARNYLAARSEVTFWKPYIEVLLNHREGPEEGVEVLPQVFPNNSLSRLCVDYYPGFASRLKGFYIQPCAPASSDFQRETPQDDLKSPEIQEEYGKDDPNAAFTQQSALIRHCILIKKRLNWLLYELVQKYKNSEEQRKVMARYAPPQQVVAAKPMPPLPAQIVRSKDYLAEPKLRHEFQILNESQRMSISPDSLLFAFANFTPEHMFCPIPSKRAKRL